MTKCECEHKAHFYKSDSLTPNGNPGHTYHRVFCDGAMTIVDTPFGKFHVCKDCANDCLAIYKDM